MHPIHQEAHEQASFVWPPVEPKVYLPPQTIPVVANLDVRISHTRLVAALKRCSEWAIQIEREWFAPVSLPLPTRIKAVGWVPDRHGDFCDLCGGSIGPHESDEFGCASCRGKRFPWARMVRLGAYEEDLMSWILEFKFESNRSLGRGLGHLLALQARRAGVLDVPSPNGTIVVPMPTTRRRRALRGLDHAGTLARGISRELDLPFARVLKKKHRPSQRSVSAVDRTANQLGAISLRRGVDLSGKFVLLVDDVCTTGSTLRAACTALRQGAANSSKNAENADPPAIWAIVSAVVPDRRRVSVAARGAEAISGIQERK